MATNPVIVGVDGTENSREALRWAVEYGRRYESPVEAIAVWETPVVYGYTAIGVETSEEIEERTRLMLAETVQEAVGDDAGVIQNIRRGDPAASLIDASESGQLLVLGTRGRGAFAGMLLGSVSQHCVAHARCPFVVVPEQEDKTKGKRHEK